MPRLRLTLACGDYDLMRALKDEAVKPESIDLTVVNLTSPERHWRMMRHLEFDVCEFSMSSYMLAKDLGQARYTAVPVFPHRRMRHSFFLVNNDAGIRAPKDLEGKRVGLRTMQNTASMWMRGILEEEYGVDLKAIDWISQDDEDITFELPKWMKHERLAKGETLDSALQAGDLACAMYPDLLPSFVDGTASNIGRLFPNAKAEEMAYYKKTGHFPIMHTLVIRDDVLAENPWVAKSLFKAFEKSKAEAWKSMLDPRKVSLVWMQDLLEEQQAAMGRDPWVYGLEPNRKSLEAMHRYGQLCGLVTKPLGDVSEWFVASTLDDTPDLLH
ncbi:MAG TPA: PhnD/SsuA/transferrin family substrate-binding protein [Chloroflexota bacterium]|nr:PhnD/SsuA/transferrin family substrate-binding protein [Chloroflexota bacterium]